MQLPKQWQPHVQAAVLNIISVARVAMAWTRGWTDNCPHERVRLKTRADQLEQLIGWLTEELAIKDARWERLPHRNRPHYDPPDRMRILQLRAIRGWTVAETARRFFVTEMTIQNWMARLNEHGPEGLVQLRTPVNKFPELVTYMVRTLKTLCPHLKTVKMAQLLCRAGLHLGVTTVRRMMKDRPRRRIDNPDAPPPGFRRTTTPNGLWHVDMTIVPSAGLWTPWLPFSLPPIWPFCWHVAIAVDHYSRRIMGAEVFKGQPTSRQVTAFLDRAMKTAGVTPQKILTDKGGQFWKCRHWLRWCSRRGIQAGFGALKVAGGICVVERAIRTFKSECCRRLAFIPASQRAFRREIELFVAWYNESRPHEGLAGATPDEFYFRRQQVHRKPRWEPRVKWKRGSPCAGPRTLVKGAPGVKLELDVEFVAGRKHLPIVRLRRAA